VKVLRVLEAEGHITLPAPQCALQITGPRLLERPVAAPVAMPDTVGRLRDWRLLWSPAGRIVRYGVR